MTDGSKGERAVTVGLDLGDRYSYLCVLDTESGEVIEEGRLRTTPEAFGQRFGSERPMRIAILVGCAHYILGPFGQDSDLRRHGQKIAERGGRQERQEEGDSGGGQEARGRAAQAVGYRRGLRSPLQRPTGRGERVA